MTKTNASPKTTTVREPLAAIHETIVLPGGGDSMPPNAPLQIVQSALDALSEGRISEVMAKFADRLQFNDHALALEFTEKARLTEFFEKSRELFPDSALEVSAVMESGDHAIAEWRLTATQTVPFLGSTSYRLQISVFGATIIRVEQGRIVEWSDYYDQSSSRRMNLAGHFTEWIEY
jgi:steroid delta-isomerase-like uncharacterized protein